MILQNTVEPYSRLRFYIFKLSCPRANICWTLIFYHFFSCSAFPFIFIFYVARISEFAKTGIARLRKSIRMSPQSMWYLKSWYYLAVEIEHHFPKSGGLKIQLVNLKRKVFPQFTSAPYRIYLGISAISIGGSGSACFLSVFTYDNNITFYCILEFLKSFHIILGSLHSTLSVQ